MDPRYRPSGGGKRGTRGRKDSLKSVGGEQRGTDTPAPDLTQPERLPRAVCFLESAMSTAPKISGNFLTILRRNRVSPALRTCPHPHPGSGGLEPTTNIATTSRPHHAVLPVSSLQCKQVRLSRRRGARRIGAPPCFSAYVHVYILAHSTPTFDPPQNHQLHSKSVEFRSST